MFVQSLAKGTVRTAPHVNDLSAVIQQIDADLLVKVDRFGTDLPALEGIYLAASRTFRRTR